MSPEGLWVGGHTCVLYGTVVIGPVGINRGSNSHNELHLGGTLGGSGMENNFVWCQKYIKKWTGRPCSGMSGTHGGTVPSLVSIHTDNWMYWCCGGENSQFNPNRRSHRVTPLPWSCTYSECYRSFECSNTMFLMWRSIGAMALLIFLCVRLFSCLTLLKKKFMVYIFFLTWNSPWVSSQSREELCLGFFCQCRYSKLPISRVGF